MHARLERLILLAALPALLVPLGCASTPDNGGAGGGQCVIEAQGEQTAGYPFNLQVFGEQIVPALAVDCASCHDPAGPNHDTFAIFAATAEQGNCDYVNTFKEVQAKSDLVTPENSPIVRAMQGQVPTHPVFDQAKIDVYLNYIRAANTVCTADGQCQPGNGIGFDRNTYETVIQPALDAAVGPLGACAAQGCHGPPVGISNFTLNPNPAPGSPEMDANFTLITTQKVNLTTPENSIFYLKATTLHGFNQSAVVTPDAAAAILAWIKDAQAVAPPPGAGLGCADATRLNFEVFRTEIYPMLTGNLDWNNPGQQSQITGCALATCHGNASLPFNLAGTPEEAMEKFACFINLSSPSRSQVILCPSFSPGCQVAGGHPGQRVFVDANDRNLQKMLSFLFASVIDVTPLDFGFFATEVNTIFSDPNACVSANEQCDDNLCHGVAAPGQLPANNSQFGILPNAADVGRLTINFASAANFADFSTPEAGSLFLYPTDLNRVDPFGTGTVHGGGPCFAPDSVFADTMLKWMAGLQPAADSSQRDWLVTGGFVTNDPEDDPLNVENNSTFAPSIFQRSGGANQAGLFVGLYEDQALVDVGTFLGGQGPRIAYAIAYYLNTTNRNIELELTVDTDNEVDIFFNGRLLGSSPDGGGLATAFTVIPPFSVQPQLTTVVLKLFQDANDDQLAFTATLADDDIPLVNDKRLIIITGQPLGGF